MVIAARIGAGRWTYRIRPAGGSRGKVPVPFGYFVARQSNTEAVGGFLVCAGSAAFSNASLMINNGFDVKAISEHLGHCNTAITSDIYTHIFKEYKAKMAESIEKDLI